MEGSPDVDVFEHPDAKNERIRLRNERIRLNTFSDDNIRINTPAVFNTASGGFADTSFSTSTDAGTSLNTPAVVRASDAVGLTYEQKVLATAVDDYYDALLKKGIEPSLGRDINNFELGRGGSLRLKEHPEINIVNTKTSKPNTLEYVVKQGGVKIVRENLGFSNWKAGEGKQNLSPDEDAEIKETDQQMSKAASTIETAPL